MAEITGRRPRYAVALLRWLERIAFADKWPTGTVTGTVWGKTRKEILDTYAACLAAVQGPAPLGTPRHNFKLMHYRTPPCLDRHSLTINFGRKNSRSSRHL